MIPKKSLEKWLWNRVLTMRWYLYYWMRPFLFFLKFHTTVWKFELNLSVQCITDSQTGSMPLIKVARKMRNLWLKMWMFNSCDASVSQLSLSTWVTNSHITINWTIIIVNWLVWRGLTETPCSFWYVTWLVRRLAFLMFNLFDFRQIMCNGS